MLEAPSRSCMHTQLSAGLTAMPQECQRAVHCSMQRCQYISVTAQRHTLRIGSSYTGADAITMHVRLVYGITLGASLKALMQRENSLALPRHSTNCRLASCHCWFADPSLLQRNLVHSPCSKGTVHDCLHPITNPGCNHHRMSSKV